VVNVDVLGKKHHLANRFYPTSLRIGLALQQREAAVASNSSAFSSFVARPQARFGLEASLSGLPPDIHADCRVVSGRNAGARTCQLSAAMQ